MAPRFGLLPTILVLCLAATSAFHCSGTRRSLPVAAKVTPSRSSQLVLVQRSKEAQANIEKWGKILSQADTFDDSTYKATRGNKGEEVAKSTAGKAAGNAVVVASAGILMAMILATSS